MTKKLVRKIQNQEEGTSDSDPLIVITKAGDITVDSPSGFNLNPEIGYFTLELEAGFGKVKVTIYGS